MNPKISIIVPVFNCEKYLCRCVDSILAQTFSDFELILINDGSTDESGRICDYYQMHDCRVHVYHKNNAGVSSARNIGLRQAKGEWITFVDGDDWLDNVYLEKLYIENEPKVDLVISYGKYIRKSGMVQLLRYPYRYVEENEIGVLFLEHDLAWQTSPWAKLYRRNKCLDMHFIEGMHIGEDLVFLYTYIMRCDMIYIVGDSYYNYDTSIENTLTRSVRSLNDELYAYNNVLSILVELMEKYEFSDEKILQRIASIKTDYIHRVLNALYHTPSISKKQRQDIIEFLDINDYVLNKEINSIKEYILKFLLLHKKYKVYDLLRVIVSIIKR